MAEIPISHWAQVFIDDTKTHLNFWNFSLNENLSDVSLNLSHLWNASGGLDLDMIRRFEHNRKVDGWPFVLIVAVYGALIAVGAAGNSLVVLAVIRKAAMRTARNVFIINLAISDLVLCLATTPLTLVELLTQYWPLGDTPFLCKLVGTLQATNIFVSTISITAIAVDRCQVILYPTQQSLGTTGALLILPCIWAVALCLAMPQFLFRTLDHHVINLPGLREVNFCYEDWPIDHGRAFYSVFVMLVQFFVPLLTVTISYARIVNKLSSRMNMDTRKRNVVSHQWTHELKKRKTNILLIAIALIFCLSWLPFNLFNIIVDFLNPFGEDSESMLIVYAVCHMLGMSSACSNPVLYGWLNDNFRKEFKEILWCFHPLKPMAKDELMSSPGTRMLSLATEEEAFNCKNFIVGETRRQSYQMNLMSKGEIEDEDMVILSTDV